MLVVYIMLVLISIISIPCNTNKLYFPFSPAVPFQQNPYNSGGRPTIIQCYRCGDTCKGEVVRVQSNHFHIRCFTCQGMCLWARLYVPCLEGPKDISSIFSRLSSATRQRTVLCFKGKNGFNL